MRDLGIHGIKIVLAGLLPCLLAGAADAGQDGPSRPFPQHVKYVSGSIKPTVDSQAAMDGKVERFYDAWKASFVRAGCGSGRYYVYIGPQGPTSEGVPISVSEATGYGMLILPHMAGYDPDAQRIFDGLFKFYRDHPSQHDADLMAWRQLSGCADTSDANSASDGDLDIAYGLLLADRQWGSSGAIDYRDEAARILSAIRDHEIHPETYLPQVGDWVSPAYPNEYNAVRTSDVMPGHFRAFRQVADKSDWKKTFKASLQLIDTLQQDYAPSTGLVPDFAIDTDTSPRPSPQWFADTWNADAYSMNACRVPWRLGADYLLNGDKQERTEIARIEDWVTSATSNNIYALYGGYAIGGTPLVYYNYVCFTGAIGVGAMIDAKYQDWLNKIWQDVAITYIDTQSDYYGETLRLLYMLTMSGNWWSP